MKETGTSIVLDSEGEFNFDDRITLPLSEELFLLVPQIAKTAMMSKSTPSRHLTQAMRWKLRHLK
jgi:hypothetical protein